MRIFHAHSSTACVDEEDEDSILRNRSFMLEGVLELTADIDSGTQSPVSSEKEMGIDEAFGSIPEAFVPSEKNANGGKWC